MIMNVMLYTELLMKKLIHCDAYQLDVDSFNQFD